MRRNSVQSFLAFLIAVGVAVAVVTFAIGPVDATARAGKSDLNRELDVFGQVLQQIHANYVEKRDDKQLIEGAIKGMVTSLDPHSSYMTAKEYAAIRDQLSGEFGGLGVEITIKDGVIRVVSPIADTPAARAGLLANDAIAEIDGTPANGLSIDQAVDKLRGPAGTSVTVTISREGIAKPFDVTMKRAIVVVNPVVAKAVGDVGDIKISSFTEHTHDRLKEAVARLNSEIGPELKGFVIDLRNDPGGLLEEAVAVSDDFLDQGTIVATKGRTAADMQRFTATPGDLTAGKPIVLLINGGSASASEIVAGALQDNRRATVVGTRSFGKGSVQSIIELGGDRGALRLTTARYFTPSDRSIQAEGIEPDIVVEEARPAGSDPDLAATKTTSEASLPNHLKNPNAPNAETGSGGSSAYVPDDPDKDTQLQYAVKLIRSQPAGQPQASRNSAKSLGLF